MEGPHGWRATSDPARLAGFLAATNRTLILLVEVTRSHADRQKLPDTCWTVCLVDRSGDLRRIDPVAGGLGPVLVRRLKLDRSTDTLGRWRAHRVGELLGMRRRAASERRARIDEEVRRLISLLRREHWQWRTAPSSH